MNLSLRPMTAADEPLLTSWLDQDARLFLGHRWPALAVAAVAGGGRGFVLCDDGQPVAAICIGAGIRPSFSRLVAPVARGRGYGRALVVLAARETDVHTLRGTVEFDNRACLTSLVRLGVDDAQSVPGGEGMMPFTLDRAHLAALPVAPAR